MAVEGMRESGSAPAEAEEAVRVIGGPEDSLPDSQPPRLGLGIALVVAGGLLGWGAASLSAESSVPTPPVATAAPATEPIVPRDLRPAPTVTWTEATTTPGIPAGYEYAGNSEAVEVDDTIYLIVNLADAATGEVTSSLWQTDDGLEWVAQELAVGEPIVAGDLTAAADVLYMTGSVADQPALFRSVAGRAVGGSSWNRIDLEGTTALDPQLLTTQIDGSGDTITVVVGLYDIWRDLLQPLVPAGIDLDDPSYVLREDGGLFLTSTRNGVDFAEPIEVLAQDPEVVVTHDGVWVRLVTTNGKEVLKNLPLPDGAYPLDAEPPLSRIPLAMVWISSADGEFRQVTARSGLPDGFFLANAWGDRLLAATFEPGGVFSDSPRATLWTSESGTGWRPIESQPPPVCSPYSLAVSGTRILLTADDGTQCVRAGDSGWEVLADRSEVAYVAGGPAGFLGYPNAFQYDSALLSRDGIGWAEIEMPGLAPYPTVSILEDRLVALSVNRPRPNRPTQLQIWVGEIGS